MSANGPLNRAFVDANSYRIYEHATSSRGVEVDLFLPGREKEKNS